MILKIHIKLSLILHFLAILVTIFVVPCYLRWSVLLILWFVSVYSILIFGLIIMQKTYACMKSQNKSTFVRTYKLQSSLVGFVVFGGKTSFGFLHE